MKKLFTSYPILSYLMFTFGFSWIFWFLPMYYEFSRGIYFGITTIGILGPPIAAFVVMHIISGVKIKTPFREAVLG